MASLAPRACWPASDVAADIAFRVPRRTTTCRYSGLRIYPGRGVLYIRVDGQVRIAGFCSLPGSSGRKGRDLGWRVQPGPRSQARQAAGEHWLEG